jgi:hypothetical protein
VFVTPGIPIATSDLPPGTNQAMFQAIASTLIYGKQDAVLVDAFMTVKQADSLADWVVAVAQKPFNASTFAEKSGHPACKQLPTWYQISTSDLMIPPDAQQKFTKQMNATQSQLLLVTHHMSHTQMRSQN